MSEAIVSLTGVAELDRKIKGIATKLQARVMRKALRAAGKPIVKIARGKARLHRRTGALEKSLGVKLKNYKTSANSVLVIGPRTGFQTTDDRGNPVDPAKYGHLLEKHDPILAESLKTAEPQARSAFREKAAQGIETELTRGA